MSVATDIAVSGAWAAQTFTRSFGYDGAGRLTSQTYPSGQALTYSYTTAGYPSEVKQGATVLHAWKATDPFGSPTEEQFSGNAFRTLRGYEAGTGRLTSIQTGTTATPKAIQDLETVWRSNSTLYRRTDKRNTTTTGDDYRDTFAYDALERVTSQATAVGASRTLSFGYSKTGNLTSKTSNVSGDLNATGYAYAGPHRLTGVTIGGVANTLSYDASGNITQYAAAAGPHTYLAYDGRNNVTQIHVGPNTGTIQARDEFWYEADGQRFLGRERWDDAGTLRTRAVVYLGGDYEEVVPPAGGTHDRIQRVQVTAVVRQIRRRNASTQVWEAVYFEYAHRDHLGSVDAITNSAGAVQQKTSFDPYGGRRSTTWNADLPATGLAALRDWQDSRGSRGFTDHEHLNRTGFVHMNGRVYDPRIGRFVSPDPIVQAPWFSQSYNRYAYVFGSPLSYTDPSGFCTHSIENIVLTKCPTEWTRVIGDGGGKVTPGATLFSVEGSFNGIKQIAWFSASSASALVGQHVTFDFEGTKITREITKADVEPSKVKKGEIVRAILSKMPWYYNASAVTCERAGCLGEYRQSPAWGFGISGQSVRDTQGVALAAMGGMLASPLIIANPGVSIRVAGYYLTANAIAEVVQNPNVSTVFSAATATASFAVSLSLRVAGATKTELDILGTIDGVKAIANEVLVPKQ